MVRGYRAELAELLTEVAERDAPPTSLETRLMVELAGARLAEIEGALRGGVSAAAAGRGGLAVRGGLADSALRVRRMEARARSWAKPRIGVLRHYEPRPLVLPAKYLRVRCPDPAPMISIVTPSYEQGRFLDRAIYSVVTQKYPALEYVVQDGGSADETVAVLGRFEPLLTAWASEPDEGQADALNRGFRHTSGEIMAWLNSDDLLLPGSLAYVARYFADHPDVDVVYGHRIMIDQHDGQVGAWILPAHDDVALTLADYVPQETLFWRRRMWDAVGGYVDPSFAYALDWDILLRFREVGANIVRLPRFLGAFRIHEEQKTTALNAVGVTETNLLRQRVHGRSLPIEEVLQRLKPYFFRHVLLHNRQRFLDRLPLRRFRVQTVPVEPWLRTPDTERVLPDLPKAHHGPTILVSPLAPPVPDIPLLLEQVLPDEPLVAAASPNGDARLDS